jgi:hypothetical protein
MWRSLPLPIRLSVLGLVATVGLVVGAVALRSPPHVTLEADVADAAPPQTPGSSSTARRSTDRTPTAVPSVPSTRSSAPPPAAASSSTADAREARAVLHKELQFARYGTATEALGRLLEIDPRAADDGEVRADIVELAMRVMLLTTGEPERVFDAIVNKMGTTGIDILYELVTTRGGSRGAAYAEELLQDQKVRAHGTPALRIAYDLRQTHDCDQKKALFPRAKTDGDGRALGLLQLVNHRCSRRHGSACCFDNDPDLREAMDTIKARLN